MANLVNPILYDAPDKTAEEKEYILLCYIDDDENGEVDKHFEIVIGRENAYITIHNLINLYGDSFDLDASVILVETKQTQTRTGNQIYFISHPKDSHSIAEFISFCQQEGNLRHEILQQYRINISTDIDDFNETPINKDNLYKAYMVNNEFYNNEMLTVQDRDDEEDI